MKDKDLNLKLPELEPETMRCYGEYSGDEEKIPGRIYENYIESKNEK